jgi:signal transduction histidine kinase
MILASQTAHTIGTLGVDVPIDWSSGLRKAQRAALDFCASSTERAIGLFEPTGDGEIKVVLPLAQFEPYCRKLRSLPQGDRLCRADHIRRAKGIMNTSEPALTLCHAGVFNQALPIAVGGKVRAVLMYGQMCIDGHELCSEARERHESVIEDLRPSEDDELELRVYYDDIERFSGDELDALNQRLSSLQRLFYGMLSEEHEQGRRAESVIHELQTRLQPALAQSENLYYALHRLRTREHYPVETTLLTADGLLKSLVAMRTVVRNLGKFMPEYEFKRDSLEEVVREAASLYKAEADRRLVQIVIDLEGPSEIEMSRPHLQEAINNLVHNGIKYSFRGGRHRSRYLSIEGRVNRHQYELSFSNYGVGILPEELERVFEPGYKGKLTRGEYRSGAGMGMAIANEIVEKHCGAIEVQSARTDGEAYVNTFTVRLPSRQPQSKGEKR